jgi:hypothetical protein
VSTQQLHEFQMQESLQDREALLLPSESEDYFQQTTPELTSNMLTTEQVESAHQQKKIAMLQLDNELLQP